MKFALVVSLVISVSVPALALNQRNTAPKKPNILFILCDDLGYGDLGSFGQTHFVTPNLDRMANEGIRLTHHYSGAPVCAPSRASLLLGQSTGHVGVRDQQFDRELASTNTIGSVMKTAGYRTLAIGKWGLGGTPEEGFPAHPMKRGFDQWYGLYRHNDGHVHYPDSKHPLFDGFQDVTDKVKDCYSTDLYTAKAKEWIAKQAKNSPNQPFLMYLAYVAPHEAFDIPDSPYPAGSGLHGGVQIPLVTHPEMKNKWIYPEFRNATYRDNNDPKSPTKPWTWQMQHYATMVRRIDAAVGDLLQTLRDLKIEQDTLVVFTSDNGPAYDDGLHPPQLISWGILDGFKRDLFEGGFREPTLVWWPNHTKRGVVDPRASVQFSWLNTFAELGGVVPPVTSDGSSLLKTLTGHGKPVRDDFYYFEYHGSSTRLEDRQVLQRHSYVPSAGGKNDPWGEQQAVRMGRYVGVRAQIQSAETPIKLYDVVDDPHEDHDLAADPKNAGLVRQIKNLMLTARIPQEGNPRPYDNTPMPAATGSPSQKGLAWSQYSDPTPWAPDTRYLRAISHGIVTDMSKPIRQARTDEAWTLEFKGSITVPTTGKYRFRIQGGATAHLWLHSSHVLDSEADRDHPRREQAVYLEKGSHPIRVEVTFGAKTVDSSGLKVEW